MAIPEVFTTTLNALPNSVESVGQNPNEDLQSMRNIRNEKEEQLKILLNLITEFEDRALKTKRNTEHVLLLKCAELLQDYASNLMKEVMNEK